MSKEKKNVQQATVPVMAPESASMVPVTDTAPKAPNEKLQEVDKMALELAKQRRQTALAEAKTALAQNENAELAYKYVVLQLYMKYGLTEADAISENGEIIHGGALPQAQVQ